MDGHTHREYVKNLIRTLNMDSQCQIDVYFMRSLTEILKTGPGFL